MKYRPAFKHFLENEVNLNQDRINTLDTKIDVINRLLEEKLDGFQKI